LRERLDEGDVLVDGPAVAARADRDRLERVVECHDLVLAMKAGMMNQMGTCRKMVFREAALTHYRPRKI
jgi:hypothetical protein